MRQDCSTFQTPVSAAPQNLLTKRALRWTRIVGALILLAIASVGTWVYLDAKRQMEELSDAFAAWSESGSSESGTQLHMHDSYYAVASPEWTIAAILGIVVGLTAVHSPGIFYRSGRNAPNTEQGGDGNSSP
jgi:hypothetical protein